MAPIVFPTVGMDEDKTTNDANGEDVNELPAEAAELTQLIIAFERRQQELLAALPPGWTPEVPRTQTGQPQRPQITQPRSRSNAPPRFNPAWEGRTPGDAAAMYTHPPLTPGNPQMTSTRTPGHPSNTPNPVNLVKLNRTPHQETFRVLILQTLQLKDLGISMMGKHCANFVNLPSSSSLQCVADDHSFNFEFPVKQYIFSTEDNIRNDVQDLLQTPNHIAEVWNIEVSPPLTRPSIWTLDEMDPDSSRLIFVRVHAGGDVYTEHSASREATDAMSQMVYRRGGTNHIGTHNSVFEIIQRCHICSAQTFLQALLDFAVSMNSTTSSEFLIADAIARLLSNTPPAVVLSDYVPPSVPIRNTTSKTPSQNFSPFKEKEKQLRLDKTLALQLMSNPGPLKSWPDSSSMQAWHLRIILAFHTGIYFSQLHQMLQLGIDVVLREISTAVIEKASEKFPDMLRLYHDRVHRGHLDTALKHCSTKFSSTIGTTELDGSCIVPDIMVQAFHTALAYLLLTLRAIPYTHDSGVMAHNEAQRLSRITRKAGISDGTFLREGADRYHNYHILWGPAVYSMLQPDIRGFLPHLVSLFTDNAFIGRFMEIANDFMKRYAKTINQTVGQILDSVESHRHGGVEIDFPNYTRTTARIFSLPPDLSLFADLSQVLFTNKSKNAGIQPKGTPNPGSLTDRGLDLTSNFLSYATEIMAPPNNIGSMLGEDGQSAPTTILFCDPFDCALPTQPSSMMLVPFKPPETIITRQDPPQRTDPTGVDRRVEILETQMHSMVETQRRNHQELMSHNAHGITLLRTQIEQSMPLSLRHAPPSILGAAASAPQYIAPARNIRLIDEQPISFVQYAENTPAPRPWQPREQGRQPTSNRFPTRMMPQLESRRRADPPPTQLDAQGRQIRRPRMPRLDINGKPILRLVDKPPTPYNDIDIMVRTHISAYGIKSEADYLARGEELCVLCGPNADHYTNRCVKIWAASEAGRRGMGVVRAAEKVRLALTRGPGGELNLVSISDSLMCFECALATSTTSESDAETAILYLVDAFGLDTGDPAEELFYAADHADYTQRLLQIGVYTLPSSATQ